MEIELKKNPFEAINSSASSAMPHETTQSRHLLESTKGSAASKGGGDSSHKRGKTNCLALQLMAGGKACLPCVLSKWDWPWGCQCYQHSCNLPDEYCRMSHKRVGSLNITPWGISFSKTLPGYSSYCILCNFYSGSSWSETSLCFSSSSFILL